MLVLALYVNVTVAVLEAAGAGREEALAELHAQRPHGGKHHAVHRTHHLQGAARGQVGGGQERGVAGSCLALWAGEGEEEGEQGGGLGA